MSTEPTLGPFPAITISRTLGSGGTQAGYLAARKLGWRFCDRRILREVARATGIPAASLRYQEERRCGFLEQLLSLIAVASPEVPFLPPVDLPVYSRELFEAERRVMRQLVQNAPAVLVGRGGCIALKAHPAVLHVCIQADLPFRTRFLVEHGKATDAAAALKLIKTSDRNRAAFIREISGLDWQDPANFDLVLDASRDGIAGCADRIAEEAGRRLS
jgi:CMP/dCMP kinase